MVKNSAMSQIKRGESPGFCKNSREKQLQENDSQSLLDSQENIFRKISAVMSQSSHSTNVGDMEETYLRAMETEDVTVIEEFPCSTYNLRPRTVKRPSGKRISRAEASKTKSPKTWASSSSEDMNSQESVSMLQECYQEIRQNDFPDLTETCNNSELEVVDIYSEEEINNDEVDQSPGIGVESSAQTEFVVEPQLIQPKELEMAKHAKFISSVVKLKVALSSKETVSDKKLWAILQGGELDDWGVQAQETQLVPKETIGYVLRTSDVEHVFRNTVQVLIQYLEEALTGDFLKIAYCWKNSIHESVVEILCQAVDKETGVWKTVASFLCKIVESIVQDDKSKNVTLESKTHFVISFCKSTHLCWSVVTCIIHKLGDLKTIQRSGDPNRLSSAYLTKNSCFLLRILESSLEHLKSNLPLTKIEDVIANKPDGKNYNVLEMWKKHWNRSEVPHRENSSHGWEKTVGEWCQHLDEISLHCLHHVPVLSMSLDRCGELAKQILKMCHPTVMEDAREPRDGLLKQNNT